MEKNILIVCIFEQHLQIVIARHRYDQCLTKKKRQLFENIYIVHNEITNRMITKYYKVSMRIMCMLYYNILHLLYYIALHLLW